jgi:exopolysaccharide/PEP-CTERM locus tyrosine autokinase
MPGDPSQRDDRLPLAERLASRLRAKEPPPPPPPVVSGPATIPDIKTVLAPAEPAPPPAAPRAAIQIDFARLQAAGFITPASPRSQQVECFRAIKRGLLKVAFPEESAVPEHNSNVVMVTSAAPDEGKTFVALNLAMSFSIERDLFVLLIDGDSNRRSLGQLLGAQKERGLVDLLAENTRDVGDIILRTNIPNLSFMPAGQPHTHGTELLSSKQMGTLMRDLGARYPDRIIIIDTSPVLATNEGVVLSSYVGQTVLVIEKDTTPKKSLQRTLFMLKEARNISCVLNRVTDEHGYDEYGY